MEMENKIKYPLIASASPSPEGRTHIVDQDGLPHIVVYRGLIGNRGRYIAACLNACMDMDLETLESGSPGWIAEKLKSRNQENPFLDALIDNQNELIKMQLESEFKAVELQKKLDAANTLNDALVQEIKALKFRLSTLESHAETMQALEDGQTDRDYEPPHSWAGQPAE